MPQSQPRDLTPEELALTQAPPVSGGTAPLRIPPGTQVAVEQLNPIADSGATTSPTSSPPDADATTATRIPAPKAPASGPSSGKRKEK